MQSANGRITSCMQDRIVNATFGSDDIDNSGELVTALVPFKEKASESLDADAVGNAALEASLLVILEKILARSDAPGRVMRATCPRAPAEDDIELCQAHASQLSICLAKLPKPLQADVQIAALKRATTTSGQKDQLPMLAGLLSSF